jgi:hypothetical protein
VAEVNPSGFLLARIAEDEAIAQAATPGPWDAIHVPDRLSQPEGDWTVGSDASFICTTNYDDDRCRNDSAHIAHYNPARVLADCAAKRKIVEWIGEQIEMNRPPNATNSEVLWLAEDVLRALALPYADHPDFLPGWKL